MSNVKPFPDTGKIKDEAAEWVVRLHGRTYKTDQDLSAELFDDLKRWMGQSPEHREQFLKMLSGWESMGVLEELADILPLSDTNTRRRSFSAACGRSVSAFWGNPWFVSGSATACLVAAVSLVWYFSLTPLEHATGVGQQATYSLEDGSTVRLNTDSRIGVDFSSDLRVITLERGEAHFDVAKDPDRPFVVFAGDGMVMAVGTAFNVRHQTGDSVNVIVSEGTVKVFSGVTVRDREPLLLIDTVVNPLVQSSEITDSEDGDYFREVVLDAGETAQYSQRRVVKDRLEEEVVLEELAWTDGILVFQGETLEQALTEISRYTNRELIIVDPAISSASVGGRFKTDDIEALAYALALGLDIQASEGQGNSILFSAK